MARKSSRAVPLFDYIEKTFGLTPIFVADRLQISRALYSAWRSGAHHMRGWQLVLIRDRFDLDWTIMTRLLELQYPIHEVEKMLAEYKNPAAPKAKKAKRRRRDVKRVLKEILD